jgi:hypothetical protein
LSASDDEVPAIYYDSFCCADHNAKIFIKYFSFVAHLEVLYFARSALLYRSSFSGDADFFVGCKYGFLHMGISFIFLGDFVFMAGYCLVAQRLVCLLVNLVFLPLWFYYIERSVLIIFIMFDAVIYFTIGLFSGSQYDFMEEVWLQ